MALFVGSILPAFLLVSRALANDPCGPSSQPTTYTWNSCTDAVNKSTSNVPSPYAIYCDADPVFTLPQNCTSTAQIMVQPWPEADYQHPGAPYPAVNVLCAGMTNQNITDTWVFARYIDHNAAAGEIGLYIPGTIGSARMMSYQQCQINLLKVATSVGTHYTTRSSVNLVSGGFPQTSYTRYQPIGTFNTGQQVDAGYPSYLARL